MEVPRCSCSSTLGPLEVLLPYIIRNDLDGGAAVYGTVLAAGGAGSIFGATLITGARACPVVT